MDDTIRKYVERALEAAEQREDELDDAALAEIARDLGLTDDDLARITQAVDDHVDRGEGYAKHQMWDDAIREFEDASELAPTRVAVRLALADALASRWGATDLPNDKARAAELARAVLNVDPKNQAAFGLLARLNPTEGAGEAELVKVRRTRILLMVPVLLLLAALAGLQLYRSQPEPIPAVNVPPPAPLVDVETFETGETDIPAVFAGAEGITIHVRRSRLATYPDRAFYTLWADVEVTGDLELQKLSLRVKLIDASGAMVKTHTRDAWSDHEADLRKGDHGVFSMLLDADPRAVSVQLEVGLAQTVAAKGPYAEAPIVEPKWVMPAPEHLKLEIRERNASMSKGFQKDKGFFKATWAFRNRGDVPIRALTYEINTYDGSDKQLDSTRRLATFSSHPPIEPGDVFLESTVASTASSYARYELVITEIE